MTHVDQLGQRTTAHLQRAHRQRLCAALLAALTWGQIGWGQAPPHPVVSMSSDGPVESFIDVDGLLGGSPPSPAPSSSGGPAARMAQLPAVQWLHELLHAPAAALDYTYIDEFLMADEPLVGETWPAPDGMQLGEGLRGGGLLGIPGAMQIAAQGTTQVLPTGLVFRPYLAGLKESRLASTMSYEDQDGWLFDNTLGTRVGLVRWGNADPAFPQGVQIDLEGSAQLRLDMEEDFDLRSADFRAGVPVTFGYGRHRTKLAYYHLSSHLGDEFLLKAMPTRLNYARDVIVLAHAIYMSPALRIYGETGWAFYTDVSEPWEFQFGLDYVPARGTGPAGAPFLGINALLREELDFSGTLSAQAGWAWRSHPNGRLLRVGAHYVNGASPQFSFLGRDEQLFGFGIWLDN
ncbi:MAG: DUF1207 domain-containing protein [Planctomycetales bacterium]|nr:DUF1207 domain-containing protein [Planctomycetales bacterium]